MIEFLKSIIQKDIMTFSVKERRWIWNNTIMLEQMPEGVAELLTKKLKDLPSETISALQVMSCFGYSINLSAIQVLDCVPNMLEALEVALVEGIIDKSGPVYAFSHDMLLESSYKLILADEKKQLHKNIALCLIQDTIVTDDAELCTLACDQVNVCMDVLNPVEKVKFASLNLAAGKHSMRASSYEQARGYFENGISLLDAEHWANQYTFSLELYEMSVKVSFMDGKTDTVLARLNEILSHAASFDDTLNARTLLAKFMVSQQNYAEGVRGILQILKDLGENFPEEVQISQVLSEIKAMLPLLRKMTKEEIICLPAMTDVKKLRTMSLMGLLTSFCNFYSPALMQLVACELLKSSYLHGYCEDTISGLVSVIGKSKVYFFTFVK